VEICIVLVRMKRKASAARIHAMAESVIGTAYGCGGSRRVAFCFGGGTNGASGRFETGLALRSALAARLFGYQVPEASLADTTQEKGNRPQPVRGERSWCAYKPAQLCGFGCLDCASSAQLSRPKPFDVFPRAGAVTAAPPLYRPQVKSRAPHKLNHGSRMASMQWTGFDPLPPDRERATRRKRRS